MKHVFKICTSVFFLIIPSDYNWQDKMCYNNNKDSNKKMEYNTRELEKELYMSTSQHLFKTFRICLEYLEKPKEI